MSLERHRPVQRKLSSLYLSEEKRLWKSALVLAVFIAFSRLYLYVHYPTDILGGIAVGLLSGYMGYRMVKKVYELREKNIHMRRQI